MLKLTKQLYEYDPSSVFMDYYEKTLINHIVPSHDQSGPTGGSTYFMPLQPGAEKHFDLKENSCCHGTGLESHFKYQESIYWHNNDELYVALYVPSTLDWKEKNMQITQSGDFLEDEKVTLNIHGCGRIKLKLRIPDWFNREPELTLNSEKVSSICECGYVMLERDFEDGDKVELMLPFSLRFEKSPDRPEIISIHNGPLVMAAIDSREEFIELPSGKQPDEILEPTDTPHQYKFGDIIFKPCYNMDDCRYHVYLKQI